MFFPNYLVKKENKAKGATGKEKHEFPASKATHQFNLC